MLVRLVSDRKSTRLNSSHVRISYAVFCLKKKKNRGINKGVFNWHNSVTDISENGYAARSHAHKSLWGPEELEGAKGEQQIEWAVEGRVCDATFAPKHSSSRLCRRRFTGPRSLQFPRRRIVLILYLVPFSSTFSKVASVPPCPAARFLFFF